jgi:hypothetical protein
MDESQAGLTEQEKTGSLLDIMFSFTNLRKGHALRVET